MKNFTMIEMKNAHSREIFFREGNDVSIHINEKANGFSIFRRSFLLSLLALFLPIAMLFLLLIHTTSQEFTDYMKRNEQQQLRLLEQALAAEFYNDSEIVRSLLIYQNVRPFYLQHYPSRASSLIRNLNNHFTNSNIVDEIYMYFFCDEYFYSTQTSFSTRSFMNQFILGQGSTDTSKVAEWFLKRMKETENAEDTFYLRSTVSKKSASSSEPGKAVLYVYPYSVDNEVVGAVIFQINEARLNSWIGNSTGRDTYLFDRTGVLLNADDFGDVIDGDLTQAWLQTQVQSTLNGETLNTTRNGYYVLSGAIPDTGLFYIRFVENATLFSALEKIQLFYLLLLFVLITFGCAALAFLSEPLRKLKNALPSKHMTGFSEVDTFLDRYNDLKTTNLQFQNEANVGARNAFLRSLLERPVPEDAIQQSEDFGIQLTAPYHFVVIGRDEFQQQENLCSVLTSSKYFLYMISVPDTAGLTSWLIGCDRFLDRRRLQNAALDGRLSVSGTRAGVAHIHDSYMEARSYWDIANAPSPYYRQVQLSIDSFYKEQARLACRQLEEGFSVSALQTVQDMYQKMKSENVPPDIQCAILTKTIFVADQIVRTRLPEKAHAPLEASDLVLAEDPSALFHLFVQQAQMLTDEERKKEQASVPSLTVEAILCFIEEHCEDENFSLRLLADHFALSLSYLSLFFKEHYGDTLLNYYTSLRMDKACHLLDNTNMPLREVATTVGYANSSSFIRRFKQLYGVTPGEYKKGAAIKSESHSEES